jgi:hypothetical protein
MPPGRAWGSTSAVYPARDGKHIWVAERCEANTCVGKDHLDTVFLFDLSGNVKDGFVQYFIPDPQPDQDKAPTSGAEGVAADADGNVYGAEVGPKALKKYVKK